MKTIKELQKECHQLAIKKGFWDNERNDGELIALIHSELSECLEYLRHDNPKSDKIPKFTGAEEELADALIRILDFAEARKWNLKDAIIAKLKFNKTRPRKHGKNF